MLSEKLQKEYDEWCRVKFGDMPKKQFLIGSFNWKKMHPIPATFIVGQDLRKGDKCEITQGGYVVPVWTEKKMLEIIKQCLKYCLHRKRNHPGAGLGVCVKDIEKVLGELK